MNFITFRFKTLIRDITKKFKIRNIVTSKNKFITRYPMIIAEK